MDGFDGQRTDESYDVVIAGAGIAGCTAATLYGRQGLRVGLVEAHADAKTFKRVCTHFIQPSAVPTLRRLGVDRLIEQAGGIRNSVDFWSPYGWVRAERFSSRLEQHGYNVRRSVLDPMLRELAAGTPGVDLLLGSKVVELLREGGRVVGLVTRDRKGQLRRLRAPLTVGADGRDSAVASASGLPCKTSSHSRFGYSAHYTGVRLRTQASSQFWLDGPGMNFAFSNDDGRTVLGVMRPAEELEAFRSDIEGNMLASFARLPEPPDLSRAQRVSAPIGMLNYPSQRRRLDGAGVTLVGDAAQVSDYLWGVGCGWAFQGAEWLVDSTAADLLRGRDPSAGLKRYSRLRARRFGPHHQMLSDYARRAGFNALERLLFSAATVDDAVAGAAGAVGARAASPLSILTPPMLARMIRAQRKAAPPVRVPLSRTAPEAAAQVTPSGRS